MALPSEYSHMIIVNGKTYTVDHETFIAVRANMADQLSSIMFKHGASCTQIMARLGSLIGSAQNDGRSL